MAASPTCIIAITAEDDRFRALREAAVDQARRSGARLILYDIDAAQMLASPMPTEWSGDGSGDFFGRTLTVADLERSGRHQVAEQVRAAQEAGVRTRGWLPQQKGADALAEYAEEQGADLIMVPSETKHPGLIDRLRGATLDKLTKETELHVQVVDDDGGVTVEQ